MKRTQLDTQPNSIDTQPTYAVKFQGAATAQHDANVHLNTVRSRLSVDASAADDDSGPGETDTQAYAVKCIRYSVMYAANPQILGFWMFGTVACKLFRCLEHVGKIFSTFILVAFSADRYLAVCHPLKVSADTQPYAAK